MVRRTYVGDVAKSLLQQSSPHQTVTREEFFLALSPHLKTAIDSLIMHNEQQRHIHERTS
jgi:hypothetical protein